MEGLDKMMSLGQPITPATPSPPAMPSELLERILLSMNNERKDGHFGRLVLGPAHGNAKTK